MPTTEEQPEILAEPASPDEAAEVLQEPAVAPAAPTPSGRPGPTVLEDLGRTNPFSQPDPPASTNGEGLLARLLHEQRATNDLLRGIYGCLSGEQAAPGPPEVEPDDLPCQLCMGIADKHAPGTTCPQCGAEGPKVEPALEQQAPAKKAPAKKAPAKKAAAKRPPKG